MLRKSPTRTEVFMAANRHKALKSTGPKAASGQTVDGMRNKGKICLRGGVNTHEGVLGQTTGEGTCWDRKRRRRTATNRNAIPTTSLATWRGTGQAANSGRLVAGQ